MSANHLLLPCMLLAAVLLVSGCAPGSGPEPPTVEPAQLTPISFPTPGPAPEERWIDLSLSEQDVKLAPLPIRAGVPFTITATIHNNSPMPAENVPVLVYLSSTQEQIGFSPFLSVLTATVPATKTVTVQVPVVWNLAGGDHRLWLRVNSLPEAWQAKIPILPEERLADNAVLLELPVEPFDAYTSDLCAGRVDIGLAATDVWAESSLQRVRVRIHNLGNQAAYNLPVIVTGTQASGMAYTPALPPCGGTAEVTVVLDRPLAPREALQVQVNPKDWPSGLIEDDFDNNLASADAGSSSGTPTPPAGAPADYDFAVAAADVDLSQPGILLLTVHNLGTRDAAGVPIQIEGKSGRKIVDAVPLVEGGGLGVAAVQLGSLSSPGALLTITVNPASAKGGYPESARGNNVLAVTLPPK